MLITQEHFKKIYQEKQIPFTFLVLILDNNCNAACKICIAKHNFKGPLCKQYCEKFSECKYLRCCDHTASDEEFYANVKDILDTINSPNLSIMVSGGEPTLSPRFAGIFELLSKYRHKITKIRMETNGANLGDEAIKNILLQNDVEILLSRYSHEEADNLQEFNFAFKPVLNTDLENYANIYGKNLRVNTVLLKKFIPDAQALLNSVKEMKSLGVKSREFVEIMADITLEASNKELIQYYNEQHVTAEDLHKQLLDTGAEVIREFRDEISGEIFYRIDDLEFTITYCKIDKKYPQAPNNFFRKFLIMPSGEIGIDGIEKE